MITTGKVATALDLSVCDQGCVYICSAPGEGRERASMHPRFLLSLPLAGSETQSPSDTCLLMGSLRVPRNTLCHSHTW